jgi:serine/threonine-protein kinase
MGEVFAAENIHTGRPVAIKLLRQDSKSKSSAIARFRQEARAAGKINSDHVTQVLDVMEDAEYGVVLVFELLEGESLIDRLKRSGPLNFDELWPIIEQVWMGLADAHRAGIIHRDLKPSNVFLERRPDGTTRVKILDFGISKVPKEVGGETLTEMGQSLGTFSFMPPEQIGKAKTVDHRADIYACATLIYQSLTGQLPYTARNILVMVEAKTKTDARKLSEAYGAPLDPRLEAFVARGLARDPAQRFQSALEALNAWRELRPAGTPPSGPSAPGSGGGAVSAGSFASGPGASSGPFPGTASSHPAHGFPQPQVMIEKPADLPRVNDVDVSTEDSVATLAMPRASARKGSPSPQGTPPLAPRLGSAAAAIGASGTLPVLGQAADGPTGPGGTQMVKLPSKRPDPIAVDERSGNLAPHPAGYYIPPELAASLARVTPSTPPPRPEETGGPTGTGEVATQIYRPEAVRGKPPSASIAPPPAKSVPAKRPLPLAVVLVGCLLLSFVVVAGVMLINKYYLH